jgi:3-hydroxyacyl-CoA dehydrogenase
MTFCDYALEGDVAVVTLQHPPVNALGVELRAALLGHLEEATHDPAVRAVVLTGNEKVFCGGADIGQLGTAKYWAHPRTIDLAERIDASPKLVLAAIGGVAYGGGLELALACHYRITAPNARLALPEVTLGLCAGGGGTLRLPRLIGVEAAVDMMWNGRPVDALRARELGLVDDIASTDVRAAALAYARCLLDRGAPLRRATDCLVDLETARAVLEHARRSLGDNMQQLLARSRMLDAIEAGLTQPPEIARQAIDQATCELIDSAESRALREAFFAERKARKAARV